MDPDRFQMLDIKRRLTAIEKALDRANARIRTLQVVTFEIDAKKEKE